MANSYRITYPTPSQPRQVRLDSTTICQLNCLPCHRHLARHRQGQMPLSLLSRILDDISSWPEPLNEIVPVNYGELFTKADYAVVLLRIASSLPKTRLVVPTNGILADIDLLASLPTLSVVNFSVNAYFPATYKLFTGVEANFEALRTKIKKLRLLKPSVSIWVSMIFSPEYFTDLERDLFIAYWKDIATPQILTAASCGRQPKPMRPVTIPCRSIFSDLVIGYDGKISSCCWDAAFSLDLGSLGKQTVKEVWNSRQLTALRKKHNEGRRFDIGLCKRCTFG